MRESTQDATQEMMQAGMQETMQKAFQSDCRHTFYRFSTKGALRLGLAITLAIAAAFTVAPAARAAGNSSKNTDAPVNTVSHVAMSSGNVTRMLLVKRHGKEYLVLGLDSSAQVAMLDVSDPSRPRSIDSAAPAPGKSASEVTIVADTLTLFGKSDEANANSGTRASAGPKELRNLPGVTTFLIDNAHGLIYAANNDGLWIVKTNWQAAMDSRADSYDN
jgi:hypothetical protein